ncbi:MAG: exo-beta-1,3-glucanase [Solirubrobacterales bacterium]
MRVFFAVFAILATAMVSFAGWQWFNRPVPVALSYDEAFPSVSFAPFRRGQSPISHDYPPPQQIEEDLKSLVGVARGVRTYTSLEGMSAVPAFARKYGLEVTHSAWLGEKVAVNEREVAALIDAANKYPDVIKRVIVGNEVLLRQDLPVEQLRRYIRQVRAAVKQPVSYADVWAFWLKNPQLAEDVDYITVHILPYWEDEPVGVDDAAEHIVKIYHMMQQAFPGKPILIGEAGWPTRGRNRGPAAVNMESAAKFVRTLAKVSKANGFDYNVVEAFDQPWKAFLEGSVGAKWGVVDENRRVKFSMSGPVQDNPDWKIHASISLVLGTLGGVWFLRRPRRYHPASAIAIAALAQLLSAAVVWQALNAEALAYDLVTDIYAWMRIAIHAAFAALILRAAGDSFADGAGPAVSRWGERLLTFYAAAAVVSTAIIFFHGRYRDIPNLEFLVPCVGLTAYALARMVVLRKPALKAFAAGRLFYGKPEGGFGPAKPVTLALLISAVAAPLSESIALYLGDDFKAMHPDLSQQIPLMAKIFVANTEMLVWSAMLVVMALPFAAEWWRTATRR